MSAWQIEKVLDVRGRPDERFYLVRWKGDWKKDKETWQNWRDVAKAQEEVDAFWELQEESVDNWRKDKAAWIPGEVRCKTCCKDKTIEGTLFKSEKSIRDHHKCKWVKPSRTGTCAERAVHRKRKKEAHDRAGTVTCEGEALKKALDFTYLGFGASTDGDNLTPMNARLQLASSRYSGMGNIWKSSEISLTLKLRIYQAAVCSVVMYGSEAWTWNEALIGEEAQELECQKSCFHDRKGDEGRIQGSDIRSCGKNKEEKTGLGQGPSTSGQSTSLETNYDCICTSRRVGKRSTDGCCSKRFGNDYGHGRGK